MAVWEITVTVAVVVDIEVMVFVTVVVLGIRTTAQDARPIEGGGEKPVPVRPEYQSNRVVPLTIADG